MKSIFSLLILIVSFSLWAQNPDREFKSYTIENNILHIETSDGRYEFSELTPSVLNVVFIPLGESTPQTSHAVELNAGNYNPKVKKQTNHLLFISKLITVKLQLKPFKLSYYYQDNYKISEKSGYHNTEDHFSLSFNVTESEILMGGGERALSMNRRGHKLQLYNRANYGYQTRADLMNFSMPILMSSKQYLIHFDNPNTGYLDFDSQYNNSIAFESISGPKRYQLVFGERWESIMYNYTSLTGRQYMPPRWALGNFSSRFGYHSQDEVLSTIKKFREEQIPVDAVILDLYWFGKTIRGTMGNLAFDQDSFPKPKKMIKKLQKKNVETILISEPFILSTSNRWQEAINNDILAKDSLGKPAQYEFYFGNTGLVDIFKPQAKNWLWDIYKNQVELGVNGFWGDLGEPEVHPDYLQHHQAKANEVHNIYGHEWARLIFENYRQNYPERRPFILMRAGYSGSQKYGMIPWSGDVSRSWGGLASQPEIALQMGLQGMAYMHSDLGGFAGNLLDDDLYVRWLQYGVFQPVFRPHAQEEVPSEPIFRSDYAKDLAKQAIELRYQLLPYNYNLTFQNYNSGMPLMRPLFFEEPQNHKLYSVAHTYLWGEDFLISPVLDEFMTSKRIYFPVTANWLDYYSPQVFKGGTTAEVNLTEDHIPTFVRTGSFILKSPLVQSTKEYRFNGLEVDFIYDPSVSYTKRHFYNDNGQLFDAFSQQAFESLKFEFQQNPQSKTYSISIKHDVGQNFNSDLKQLNFKIRNSSAKPSAVKFDGNPVDFSYNAEEKAIYIKSLKINSEQHNITIIKS